MASNNKKILVVDDDPLIRRILTTRLSMVGYNVATATDGKEALNTFTTQEPDVVVLDVMMPQMNGFEVCQELRETTDVPIIMLTALGDVADRITGLQVGADDYIAKPFSPRELEVRINAILRRTERTDSYASSMSSSGIVSAGALKIEIHKRQVYLDDQRIKLTSMEFHLLMLLVMHCGKVVTRSEILQQVWGYGAKVHGDLRIVDVHISRLRAKLGDDSKNPEFIHTDRGTGYFFQRNYEPLQAIGA